MIAPQTFQFLQDLKSHNVREWFEENRKRYEAARNDVAKNLDALIAKMAEFDPDVQGLEGKKTMFRINRDVRFSKNKDPYKTNFGAGLSRGGKNFPGAGYYVHLDSENCFMGGGMWQPETADLRKIREYLDVHGADLTEIIEDPEFKAFFGEIEGERLKTAPQGFDKDHPYLHFLQLKSYVVTHAFTAGQASQPDFIDWLANGFRIMQPFKDFLNEALDRVAD